MTQQKEYVFPIRGERKGTKFKPVPLRVLLPCANHAYTLHNATLAQLKDRGGLTPHEALHVLYNIAHHNNDESRRIWCMTPEEADRELRCVVRTRYQHMILEEQDAGRWLTCSHSEPTALGSNGISKCARCGCLVNL